MIVGFRYRLISVRIGVCSTNERVSRGKEESKVLLTKELGLLGSEKKKKRGEGEKAVQSRLSSLLSIV